MIREAEGWATTCSCCPPRWVKSRAGPAMPKRRPRR